MFKTAPSPSKPWAIKNAAVETSLGIFNFAPLILLFSSRISFPSVFIRAPRWLNMISVWLRDLTFSVIFIVPPDTSAANNSAPLTCADEVSKDNSLSSRTQVLSPVTKRALSVFRMSNPISRNGRITLSIGRRDKEASPLNTALIPSPAATPASSRAVVPLFPQSSTRGSFREGRALSGYTVTDVPRKTKSAPIFFRQSAVDSVSLQMQAFSISVVPSASAPQINARWVIDLSPKFRRELKL